MSDRTVHARNADDTVQVVRYDKAGKWYVEVVGGARSAVTLTEAVAEARRLLSRGGAVHLGKKGGAAFDRKVKGDPIRLHDCGLFHRASESCPEPPQSTRGDR